jgi:D-arabinose 5-phosphate isomerase GutQ
MPGGYGLYKYESAEGFAREDGWCFAVGYAKSGMVHGTNRAATMAMLGNSVHAVIAM